MGFVVDAVSSVVEGAVDVVGSVAEGAVDLAGDVIEAVADNPLLIAAAIAAPYALGGLAAEAGVASGFANAAAFESAMGLTPAVSMVAGYGAPGALASAYGAAGLGAGLAGGVDATSMGLIGSPLMGAPGATPGLLSSYEMGAGAGSGILGGGATAGGLTLAPATMTAAELGTTGYGSTLFGSNAGDVFSFMPSQQASTFQSAVNTAANSPVATFNQADTLASTIANSNPSFVFDSNYLSSNTFTQMQNAASLSQSPGMSFSDILAQTTGGTVTPTNATSMFTNAWDSAKGIINQVNDFTNKIGQTIAPNADPMVQKAITNFGTNMVTTGGDVEQSLKGTAIGTGVGFVGKQVADLAAPTLGATGAKIAGSTAANVAGSLATGAPIENALIGGAASAAGAGTTNLTGSPLLGNIAGNLTGTALSGGDIGSSLLKTGLGAGASALNQTLGINPNSVLGKIVNPIQQNVISSLTAQKTNVNPIRQASSLTSVLKPTPTSGTTQKSPLSTGVKLPAQQVDVSKLTPVDITTLGLKG